MLQELAINVGVLLLGLGLGYFWLPVLFRHNHIDPAAIAAHLQDVGKGYGSQAALIIDAHAKAMIASVKEVAAKLGVPQA